MTAVTLPTTPSVRVADPMLIDFGSDMVPILGGPVQRVNRMGSRYSLTVELPPVKEEPNARIWASALRQAKQLGAIFTVPQPGLTIGSPGTPLVNGAHTGGTSLSIKGLSSTYALKQGQFLSIIHSSRRYLYAVAADATASGGNVTVTLETMLRTALANNDVIEIATPKIEGYLDGDPAVKMMLEPYRTVSFRIVERE